MARLACGHYGFSQTAKQRNFTVHAHQIWMFSQQIPFISWTAGDLAAWCMMATARQVVQSQLDLNFMQTGSISRNTARSRNSELVTQDSVAALPILSIFTYFWIYFIPKYPSEKYQ